jgi:hypothetical protein
MLNIMSEISSLCSFKTYNNCAECAHHILILLSSPPVNKYCWQGEYFIQYIGCGTGSSPSREACAK